MTTREDNVLGKFCYLCEVSDYSALSPGSHEDHFTHEDKEA